MHTQNSVLIVKISSAKARGILHPWSSNVLLRQFLTKQETTNEPLTDRIRDTGVICGSK